MTVFVAGMLVLILLSVFLCGFQEAVTERELRRQYLRLREQMAELQGAVSAACAESAGMERKQEDRCRGDWMEEGMDNLLSYMPEAMGGIRHENRAGDI